MNTYFHKLTLPEVPLKNVQWIDEYEWTSAGYHIWKHPRNHLSDELLDIFDRAGIKPGYLVFFCNDQSKNLDDRMVHTDLVTVQDPRFVTEIVETTPWRRASFGINFELYNGLNHFHWYNEPTTTPALMPTGELPVWNAWLQGIHYGARKQIGIPPDCQEQAQTTISSKPTLVRSDVPHSTDFTLAPDQKLRLGVSIRFYEPWTWTEAEAKFAPWFE